MNKIFSVKDWRGSFLQNVSKPEFYNIEDKNVEISEDVYDNFLESLPPISIFKGFMNSEPYSHNANGEPRYLAFQHIGDKYYFIGLLTRNQAKLLQI